LILVGTDFPYLDFYPDGVPALQIDIDPVRLGRRHAVDVGLAGHARPTLAELTRRVVRRADRGHLEGIQAQVDQWRSEMENAETPTDPPLRPQALARRVGDLAADDSVFVCDTGTVTFWAARHLRIRGSQRFVLSSSLASMGFAMPGAIGAQLAYPNRPVIALAGDGGLSMLLGDFLTAVKYELPITVVVFNNGKLGLIQMEQEAAGRPEYETELQDLDYGSFAELCGGRGARVRRADELDDALRRALSSKDPWIVDVQVDPEELTVPPRIEPGQALGFGLAKVKEFFGRGDRDGVLPALLPGSRGR
jgi:thiamine pyrophosphate-dependent acetolactate synthase large subunit-like protein